MSFFFASTVSSLQVSCKEVKNENDLRRQGDFDFVLKQIVGDGVPKSVHFSVIFKMSSKRGSTIEMLGEALKDGS